MRRPFLGVVLSYAFGVCLGDWFQPPLACLFGALAFWLALFWALPRARPLLWVVVLVWAGWFNRVRGSAVLSPCDLRSLVGAVPALGELYGTLVRSPVVKASDTRGEKRWHSHTWVEVAAVRLDGEWQPAAGRVWAQVPDILGAQFFRGRWVVVTGVMKFPATAVAPGLFDRRAYLSRQGVYYEVATDSLRDWRVVDPMEGARVPWSDRFLTWARATLALGLPEDDEALQLRWAMLLGWKGGLTQELRTPFMHSGSMHVFAISGLHVTLVAGVLVAALRLLRVTRGWSGLGVIPTLWLYAAVTGWQPSAVRATVMMSVVVAGWALRRPSDLLNSLAGAAWLILLWAPQQLFQAGFQLSFGVVMSLAVLLPVLQRWRDRWLGPEPWLPRSLEPRRGGRFRTLACRAWTPVAVSLAAWVGSLPLVAWHFHLVTPVSLLANLLIVPLSAGVVLTGMCSLACGSWWVWAAECFNHSGWAAMRLMMEVSAWAAQLPGAWYPVARPSPGLLVGYFALVLWPLSGGCQVRWRFVWLGAAGMLMGCGWVEPRLRALAAVEVTVLPVGGGDSVWVDLPGRGRDALVDTGDGAAVEWVVGPFLGSQGRRDIPSLVLSHGDSRHVGGAAELSVPFAVERVLVSPMKSRSSVYRRVLEALEARGIQRKEIIRGVELGPVRVLHPERHEEFTRADDQAVVLLLTWCGTRVLLCSDLGRLGQGAMVEREGALRVDVVVAGMPSSEEPLQQGFLEVLQPKVIVVSTGRYPANQQASRALRLRLARSGVPVFTTGEMGAVRVRIDGEGTTVSAMDGTRVRWTREEASGDGMRPGWGSAPEEARRATSHP